jgi:hypothetical protein
MSLTITPQQKAAAGVLAGLRALAGAYHLTPQSAVKYTAVDLSSDDFASTVPFL